MGKSRKIIEIDEEKCDGCGLCVPACPEGALQIIDGKARLVSELYCDGLGACVGNCPKGAIRITERKAEPYNERLVMERIIKQGQSVIIAHLNHLKEHGHFDHLEEALKVLKERSAATSFKENFTDIPEAKTQGSIEENDKGGEKAFGSITCDNQSQLRQWPIQLSLVPISAPYFSDKSLLVSADCVPFAYAGFHANILKGKSLVIGCPKLDDAQFYVEKLAHIFKNSRIRSVTVATMEVPCCQGLRYIVEDALKLANKSIPVERVLIGINGEIKMRCAIDAHAEVQ